MMTNNVEDPEQAPSDSSQQQQQQQQSPSNPAGRFPKWIALAVLSLVAWFATIGGVQRHQMDRSEKWALTATTLSVVFATLGVLCYLFARGVFMGQLPEVVVVSLRVNTSRDCGSSSIICV
jgi:H+/gluconate symporter-like permease